MATKNLGSIWQLAPIAHGRWLLSALYHRVMHKHGWMECGSRNKGAYGIGVSFKEGISGDVEVGNL